MHAIKPTMKIAYTVICRHTFISTWLLFALFLAEIGAYSLYLVWNGRPVSIDILRQTYLQYQGFIAWISFVFYAFPVSQYAAIKSWQYRYKGFRFIIYETSKPERQVGIDKVAS